MYVPKPKRRDDRDFDTTFLRSKSNHGKTLHRDYSAHFFRWSFARRFIKPTDAVLEVGCGPETPLQALLFKSMMPHAERYVGVDLNALPNAPTNQHCDFYPEFDFTRRWRELQDGGQFDVAVCMEVIEHMKVEHGRKLLRGMHALLRPGGTLLLSTPCYDGKRHAANHIHEYAVAELARELVNAGFEVHRRFGTFMDVKNIGKDGIGGLSEPFVLFPKEIRVSVQQVAGALSAYYDRDALSCFFAPLYPDHARNNLWVCQKS